MLASILASGLAAGAIYALVGVTYNTMFSTSRVMSFTAGQLAMLGGVFGSMFTLKLGMPLVAGFLLTLLGCAVVGIITEFVAVRPVLKNLDQHLYVLSTLALALMIQQVAAIKWGTEPQPFPRLIGWGSGVLDEKFWLPVVACGLTIGGLEYLYRRTLVGRAFLAIARRGTGVLLVEHHADLIFEICDHVTVLNLGRTLAAGTPAEIRVHKEVVSAYLGG
jgi:branched-chain amino acid transport system permease protein